MKFLVDNQLPSALVKFLISKGHHAFHVLELGLASAKDSEIWNYAATNSYILVTKDEDFSRRASQTNASVKVIWVRRGNCRTAVLLAAFESVLPQIAEALQTNQLVEMR